MSSVRIRVLGMRLPAWLASFGGVDRLPQALTEAQFDKFRRRYWRKPKRWPAEPGPRDCVWLDADESRVRQVVAATRQLYPKSIHYLLYSGLVGALSQRNHDAIRVLLEARARFNLVRPQDGTSAIDGALLIGGGEVGLHEGALQALLEAGADPTLTNFRGNTLIDDVVRRTLDSVGWSFRGDAYGSKTVDTIERLMGLGVSVGKPDVLEDLIEGLGDEEAGKRLRQMWSNHRGANLDDALPLDADTAATARGRL